MSNIYKGAQSVFVWLGKDDQYTAPALECLKRSEATPARLDDETRMYYKANFTNEELDSIICFFCHIRWFSRLWTIQETILAQELIFLCGRHIAPLERIWAGASTLRYRNDRIRLNPGYHTDEFHEKAVWAAQFYQVGRTRYDMLQNKTKLYDIGCNSLRFHDLQATDLRDKVFGLIGISHCHHECIDEPLVANYDLTVQEVFTRAARLALFSCRDLHVLSYPQCMEGKKTPNLPSWVTDLAAETNVKFQSPQSSFQAATVDEGSRFTLEFEGDALVLAAYPWDRVVEVGDSWKDMSAGRIKSFLKVFLNIGSEYSFTNECLPVAMRRILITDRLDPDSHDKVDLTDKEYDLQASFNRILFRLICYSLKMGAADDSDSGSSSDSNSSTSREVCSIGGGYSNTNQDSVECDMEDGSNQQNFGPRPRLGVTLHETKGGVKEAEEDKTQDDNIQLPISPSSEKYINSKIIRESNERSAIESIEQISRILMLERFFQSPEEELPRVMGTLGFPNITDYAPLEASILDGARLCQQEMADFARDVDFFSTVWSHSDPYASSWGYYTHGRVPFRTERGYLGLAVDSAVVGDDVYLVEGAGTPYILRAKDDSRFAENFNGEDGKMSGDKTLQASNPLSSPGYMEMEFNDKEAHQDFGGNTITKNKATADVRKTSQKQSPRENEWLQSAVEDSEESIVGSSNESSGSSERSNTSGDSPIEASYENGGAFTLRGEVYLHGIMHGEALAKENGVVFKKVRIY